MEKPSVQGVSRGRSNPWGWQKRNMPRGPKQLMRDWVMKAKGACRVFSFARACWRSRKETDCLGLGVGTGSDWKHAGGFFLGWWKYSKIESWEWSHNSVNLLKSLSCTLMWVHFMACTFYLNKVTLKKKRVEIKRERGQQRTRRKARGGKREREAVNQGLQMPFAMSSRPVLGKHQTHCGGSKCE